MWFAADRVWIRQTKKSEAGFSLLAALAFVALVGLFAVFVTEKFTAGLWQVAQISKVTEIDALSEYLRISVSCGLTQAESANSGCRSRDGNPRPVRLMSLTGETLVDNLTTTQIGLYEVRAFCRHPEFLIDYRAKLANASQWKDLLRGKKIWCLWRDRFVR
jgi:hypothetical protein